MDNRTIAQRLTEYASVLEADEDNVYRARAYRRAAETILGLNEPAADLVTREGRAGLEELPGIGAHLSFTIDSLVRTGELRTVRGAGHADPRRLFASLPGVGPHLARTIHEQLGLTTLEELELAAHDGRLAGVGVGPKRLRGIIDALANRLARYRLPEPIAGEPPVAELLAIDREYRERADTSRLPTISPRRFNPDNEPWLPLYHTDRGGWRYRALFSNTALAHRLGQTHDWVVVAFNDGVNFGQRTIVTETRGELRGLRVVRGLERECRDHYQSMPTKPTHTMTG
jgi:DNA polymerase (family X)